MQPAHWILWNIFLAVIPVVTGALLAWGAGVLTVQRKKLPWLVWLPLAIVWYAFLPNTCYLLTEWRHFLLDPQFAQLRSSVGANRAELLVAKWGLFYLIYSGIGVLCFALSIRPIDKLLRRAGVNMALFAIPFFFLTSLGVYLGLIIRLNSWEIVQRPRFVLDSAVHALEDSHVLKLIVTFAVLLWLLYEAVDIWIDGVTLRLKSRGAGKKPARAIRK